MIINFFKFLQGQKNQDRSFLGKFDNNQKWNFLHELVFATKFYA